MFHSDIISSSQTPSTPLKNNKIMKKMSNIMKSVLPVALLAVIGVTSCNKNVPEAMPIAQPVQAGSTIGEILNTNTNFSILKAAVTKAGLMPAVSDKNNVFTVFAPSDAAFTASGISLAVINALPAASVTSIVQYHIVPGRKIMANDISTAFPNVQMPTAFVIPAPNTSPLVRFSNFPSRRAGNVWVNNIPVVTPDVNTANGAIHVTAAMLNPPSRVLLDTMARDADLQYLVAAVLAADAGVPAGSKFQDFLANPLANFTVMAPTNQAFMNLFAFLGLPQSPASFSLLPAATVRGIVAYHLVLARAFAANLPTAATPVPSLLSASLPTAPLLTFSASQGVKGAANPIYSKITASDRHAINGVYHKIDQVLMPQ
jgi:uncharacterized surface protein with fasciclin (FAS1) repeats